jgi:peptidoglycan hydrolase-like protein with peptidoglycan-binding domain
MEDPPKRVFLAGLLATWHDGRFQRTSPGLRRWLFGVIATHYGRLGIEYQKLDLGGESCIHWIVLTFAPFAASARMMAAARNNPPFAVHERGVAVALLQAGLLQQNILMPRTMKKGSPDGDYGSETVAAVTTFQRNNKLAKLDGIAGKDTIMLLDKLLAQAASNLPPIPVPPPSPVDRNYEIGTMDPPLAHDPGAGVWGSKRSEASYIALRLGIIQVLPESAVIIGPDAARHMAHYLVDNDGRPLTINLEGMVRDVPSAKARFQREVVQMQRFVETLPLGSVNPFRSKNVEVGYNTQRESRNWFFAIGGYSTWGMGTATVSGTRADPFYNVDFEYKFYDRYNWDAGKSVTFAHITVTDKFMGEFHRQGLAQEYDCRGSFRRRLNWKKGQSIPSNQLDAPGGRA